MAMRIIFFKLKKPFVWQICLLIGTVRQNFLFFYTVYLIKANTYFRQLVNMGLGFPGGSVVKNPLANAEYLQDEFNPWVEQIPWRRI